MVVAVEVVILFSLFVCDKEGRAASSFPRWPQVLYPHSRLQRLAVCQAENGLFAGAGAVFVRAVSTTMQVCAHSVTQQHLIHTHS